MLRPFLLVAVAALLWTGGASAGTFTKSDSTLTADDGTALAQTTYIPDGSAPAGGFPGVVVLHGLDNDRGTVSPISETFAAAGYAVLAYDARGHGVSGGQITLAGPREIADLREVRDAFAARTDVSDTQIGAWGMSYGGGEIWNALARKVPFAAVEVVETWTDLFSAFFPQNLAKSGIVYGFTKPIDARSPLVSGFEDDAAHSRNLAPIRPLLAERSVLQLGGLSTRVPVYMFQGRVDWAFDIAQASDAYRRLQGPKKLYVGDFGHTPSTFPGPDVGYVLSQGTAWFDRYLKGMPNGIDKAPPVAVAKERWDGKPASFAGLPPTRTVTVPVGPALKAPLEIFGGGSLTVRVTKLHAYARLVAVVTAGGKELTHGAVVPWLGTNTIRLANYAVFAPKGARIYVRLGADGGPGDIAYLGFGDSGSIALGKPTLRLSVLRTPISG
ncbi:MAG: alpha/beta hydrolase [Gaiellaceae bacterium]